MMRKQQLHPSRPTVQPLEPRLLFAAADLDPTFSGDGKALIDFADSNDRGQAVAVQADGKILIAGDTTAPNPFGQGGAWVAAGLVRLNVDGSFDASFGRGGPDGDGRVTLTTLDDRSTGRVVYLAGGFRDVVALPGGKFLVAADRYETSDVDRGGMAVLRFNSDGTLDDTFGGGDGIALADFGSTDIDSAANEFASALALGPDGKIVLVGSVRQHRALGIGVARFNPDGSRDTPFPGDGRLGLPGTYKFDTGDSDPHGVAVAPNGDIIIAGSATESHQDMALLRLAPDGRVKDRADLLAVGLGEVGTYDVAQGNAVAVQPDGKILVGGSIFFRDASRGSDFAVLRVTPDFERDPSFAGDGLATAHFSGPSSGAASVVLLPGGKILAAGLSHDVFALARFNPNGSLDKTFDSADGSPDGRKTTNFGTPSGASDAAVAPDGRIVLLGGAGADMAVARYTGDGAATPPNGPVTYQAENGTLSGAIVSRNQPGYTGTGYVDYIESARSYVQLEVNVSAAGRYRLDVRYANGASHMRPLDVYLDDAAPPVTGMFFFPTGSWSTWKKTGESDVAPGPTFTLAAGRHTIRIQTVGVNGPNIDSVTLTPVSTSPVQEAEAARLVGAVVRSEHPGFSGSGYADFQNDAGDSIQWTLDVPVGDRYELAFGYANGGTSDRPMDLWFDGVRTGRTVDFAPTGGWSNWSTATVAFGAGSTSAGTHTVKLVTNGKNGPNIDWLKLRPA